MKPLPCACNKQRIYDFFNDLSRDLVSSEIWKALMNGPRKLDIEQAKREKRLLKIEVKNIMVGLGEITE